MQVQVVDPSAYTPPYDHALCAALAAQGVGVELVTSGFAYGPTPSPAGYAVRELFYRRSLGAPGSRLRLVGKLAQHLPDMMRLRAHAAAADVIHFQWLAVQQLDWLLLPGGRPLVLTAHDVLPREPRPGQLAAQRRLYARMDAVVVHSAAGRWRLTEALGVDPAKVEVIPHGVFDYLVRLQDTRPLAPELAAVRGPVVLCFGLLRPYKGIDVLLEAWRGIAGAELWIVGRPRMALEPLRELASPGVRFVPRFISDPEIPALFRRADLVVLPYREIDQSGVLATALAFGKPLLLTDVGGFPEIAALGAATLVPPGDPVALHDELARLLADDAARVELSRAATAAAQGPLSWPALARRTIALYERLLTQRAGGSPASAAGESRR